MNDSREVSALFNAKAREWNQKYERGGALAPRVAAFTENLERWVSLNGRILDLGCGTSTIAAALAGRGFRVAACDVAEQMIETGKQIYSGSSIEWTLLPPDWKKLPFESDAFDGIIASSVFEYLPDVNMVLEECYRTLKNGGHLFFTVPNPRHAVRRLEKIVRPVAMAANRTPVLNRIPRLQSYAAYLKCSRNHLPLDEWFALGRWAGFTTVEEDRNRAAKTALVFLVLRKTEDKSQSQLENHQP